MTKQNQMQQNQSCNFTRCLWYRSKTGIT